MAININNVYQKVLALSNKEQRGYITPQEFNYFADQAQLDIFEGYFNDLARFLRMQSNDTVYADKVDTVQERIDFHEKFNQNISMSSNVGTLPTHYKLGKVYTTAGVEIQKISTNELNHYTSNNLLKPTATNPVFIKTSATTIAVYPETITSNVACNLIEKPATPNWTYVIINGKALYNSGASDAQDFDLHDAEENNLIMRILELSGITLKDPALTETALRDQAGDKAEKNN